MRHKKVLNIFPQVLYIVMILLVNSPLMAGGEIYAPDGAETGAMLHLSGNALLSCIVIPVFLVTTILLLLKNFSLKNQIREREEELRLSIIDSKKNANLLKDSEKRFRRIFNRAPAGLILINHSGKVILFNESAVKIFGVMFPEEIHELDLINSPLSTDWFRSRLKNRHSINIEIKFDFDIIRETGYFHTSKSGINIFELAVVPVEISQGSSEPGYLCQFSDNTKERQLFRELKRNQLKHELIFDSIKDGLWEWDIVTGKVRYNRKFFTFLGYPSDSYPDDINTLLNFVHDDHKEYVKNELYEKVSKGRNFNIEYSMIKSNGKSVKVRTSGETIEWDDNLNSLKVIAIQSEIPNAEIPFVKKSSPVENFFNSRNRNYLPGDNPLEGRVFLIVNDNYLIYLHISELLKKYNARSLFAGSSLEAIDTVKEKDDISLIILDNLIPGSDGVTVLNAIRRINREVPAVVLTGESDESMHKKFILEGFNAILGKPVEENLFLETVSGIIKTFFYNENI